MGGQWASRGCAHDGAYLLTSAATGGSTSPDAATDIVGGIGTMHASNRLLGNLVVEIAALSRADRGDLCATCRTLLVADARICR